MPDTTVTVSEIPPGGVGTFAISVPVDNWNAGVVAEVPLPRNKSFILTQITYVRVQIETTTTTEPSVTVEEKDAEDTVVATPYAATALGAGLVSDTKMPVGAPPSTSGNRYTVTVADGVGGLAQGRVILCGLVI